MIARSHPTTGPAEFLVAATFGAEQQAGELFGNGCLSHRARPGEEVGMPGVVPLGAEEFDDLPVADDALKT